MRALTILILVGCTDPGPQTLTLTVQGASESVSSDPAGASCDSASSPCSHEFPHGTHVKLTYGLTAPNTSCYIQTCSATPASAGKCDDLVMDEPVMVTIGCYNP